MATYIVETAAASVQGSAAERRGHTRVHVSCPVKLSRPGEAAYRFWTDNVSCEGFSCVSGAFFTPGEILNCELTISPAGLGGDFPSVKLSCQAQVMRVQLLPDGSGFLIGFRIGDYTISTCPGETSPCARPARTTTAH